MKGIEAKERTFIASQSERSMLESLSKSLDVVDDMKKLGAAWKRISNLKKKSCPFETLNEVHKEFNNAVDGGGCS